METKIHLNNSNHGRVNYGNDHEISYNRFIIYACIIFVIATWIICSNILVILAIVRTPKLRKRSGIFIGSLACADILCGVLVPPTWLAGILLIPKLEFPTVSYVCGFSIGLQILSLMTSIFSLILVAFERYLAIVWPLHCRSLLTKKRCYWLVGGAWAVTTILTSFNIPWNTYHGVGNCDAMHMRKEYFFSVIYICFWGMLLLMIFFYSRVVYTNRNHSRYMRRLSVVTETNGIHVEADKIKQKTDTKLCKLVLLVVGVFCVCWIPRIINHTLLNLGYHNVAATTIAGRSSYSNYNFIINSN